MKIRSLQISNILSFKYYADVGDAEKLILDDGLNIIIGENGAGKSTALEVINFLFKKVLYRQFEVNQDLYSRRAALQYDERRQILTTNNSQTHDSFRLDANWDTPTQSQTIRLQFSLDDIDRKNIQNIKDNIAQLMPVADSYTAIGGIGGEVTTQGDYVLDVNLLRAQNSFSISFVNGVEDFGFNYLANYHFYKELIRLHNLENPKTPLTPLQESFTLISSYRNYHSFQTSISLRDADPSQQMHKIIAGNYSRSLNQNDQAEPNIFGLVRLRVAEKHFHMLSEKLSEEECEEKANGFDFILAINKKIKVVNLECKVRLIDKRTWQYAFEFLDLRRRKVLSDINSLSAGQKAIIHLVFESYGRGELKGGVVIIDEPEIHLHHQFQNEYLQVIRELNKEQDCQYVLVTHSEALINSSTINQVKRFSLNTSGNTEIKAPTLSTSQRMLIKILDNTRSTYAFFAKKVLLVEGDTDRYFYKSIIQDKYPELDQQIAVLDMGGKGGYEEWSKLFESFGLLVYCIADLDFTIERFYPTEKGTGLKNPADITAFKARNPDWETKIDTEYTKNIYILKDGDLEHYLGIPISKKGLTETIDFCNNKLSSYLKDNTNKNSKEIREIIRQITA